VGEGVVSRVKELLRDDIINKKITVNACHFGEAPEQITPKLGKLPTSSKKRFINKKAEQYFRLRELLEEGRIDIPDDPRLRSELLKMKWDFTISEKIKIIDPEDKSPDFSDALVFFVWKANRETAFFFG
jgi:hypothetical protein